MPSWGTTAIRWLSLATLIAATVVALLPVIAGGRARWTRKHPLVAPIAITQVNAGTLTLADGRILRPAGVKRKEGVSIADFDAALRVATSQGVIVTHDLDDGAALFMAEPKFFSSCGTCAGRGANRYLQCPVSELLIATGYATIDADSPGLTARERWRLEGLPELCGIDDEPTRISEDQSAFQYTSITMLANMFVWSDEYDELLEIRWKPPPP